MIKPALHELLKQRGKTLYWLSKQTGIRYPTLHDIANAEEIKRIDMRIVERICRALQCEIQDILIMSEGEAEQ